MMQFTQKFFLLMVAVVCALNSAAAAANIHGQNLQQNSDPYKMALEREQQGFRNKVYDGEMDFLLSQYQEPLENWNISDYELLGSVKVAVSRAPVLKKISKAVLSRFGQKLIPVEIFVIFRQQYQNLMIKELGFSPKVARAFVLPLERQAVMAAGLDYKEYLAATGRKLSDVKIDLALVREGADLLMKTSTVDMKTDVPYVAGYADNDNRYILIDRHLPSEMIKDNYKVQVSYLLNVHERIEVIGLKKLGMTYPHAHQIALRSERLASIATGVPWSIENEVMDKAIIEIGQEVPEIVHPHLDMIAYYSYTDLENKKLVEKMECLKVRPQSDCP